MEETLLRFGGGALGDVRVGYAQERGEHVGAEKEEVDADALIEHGVNPLRRVKIFEEEMVVTDADNRQWYNLEKARDEWRLKDLREWKPGKASQQVATNGAIDRTEEQVEEPRGKENESEPQRNRTIGIIMDARQRTLNMRQ